MTSNPFVFGPFPAVDVKVTVPAGTPGKADVTVTTTAGSHTLFGAFHYAANVADFPSADKFQAVLFDRFRNQLYLSAGDHVDVFSLQTRAFVAPIRPPGLNGTPQFGGLALTPDGSRLLVGNLHDGSLAIVNPDSPSTASVVAVSPQQTVPCPIGPASIATTSTGKALILTGAAPAIGCGPGGSLYQVDLSTLQVSQPGGCGGAYLSATRDGGKVAFGGSINGPQGFCIYDVATNLFSFGQFSFGTGAAAAGDGNVFAGMWHLTDSHSTELSRVALPDVFFDQFQPIFGNSFALQEEKLNDSGSLLFAPFQQFVDIFDVQHGVPVLRLTLTEQVQNVLDAMAIDPAGDQVFLITSAGLTIVRLDAAPLSIGSIVPTVGSTGTQVTIRGSGFTSATTVSFNGIGGLSSFVDSSTLTVTLPFLSSGPVQVTVTNPGGQSYSLDNALNSP